MHEHGTRHHNNPISCSIGQKRRFENPVEREKAAEGTKRAFQNPVIRAKYCIPVTLVETGQVFESAKEAEKVTGCARSTICYCCKNNALWKGMH